MTQRGPEDTAWCHIHHRIEDIEKGDYRICGECGHIFRTADELVAEDLRVRLMLKAYDSEGTEYKPVEPALIFTCPLCAHDF